MLTIFCITDGLIQMMSIIYSEDYVLKLHVMF